MAARRDRLFEPSGVRVRQQARLPEEQLLKIFLGRAPAPRAWDHLFASNPAGLVRLQLKESGDWVGGLFRADSYAAGYPEEPQDLSLEQAYEMLADGTFATNDEVPVELGSGMLIRWDEIRVLEIFHD